MYRKAVRVHTLTPLLTAASRPVLNTLQQRCLLLGSFRNIGPVCLPNVGLKVTAHHKCWITRFGHRANGEAAVVSESVLVLIAAYYH